VYRDQCRRNAWAEQEGARLILALGGRLAVFPEGAIAANISLKLGVKIKEQDLDNLGHDFEKVHKGFIDFLLLAEKLPTHCSGSQIRGQKSSFR